MSAYLSQRGDLGTPGRRSSGTGRRRCRDTRPACPRRRIEPAKPFHRPSGGRSVNWYDDETNLRRLVDRSGAIACPRRKCAGRGDHGVIHGAARHEAAQGRDLHRRVRHPGDRPHARGRGLRVRLRRHGALGLRLRDGEGAAPAPARLRHRHRASAAVEGRPPHRPRLRRRRPGARLPDAGDRSAGEDACRQIKYPRGGRAGGVRHRPPTTTSRSVADALAHADATTSAVA